MDKNLLRVGSLESLRDMRPHDFSHHGIPLTVVRAGGEVNAFIRVCSHADRVFDQTKMKNGCILCPFHGGKVSFDGRTGQVKNSDGKVVPAGLRRLKASVIDGVVYVRLREADFDFMAETAMRRAERESRSSRIGKKGRLFRSLSRLLGEE